MWTYQYREPLNKIDVNEKKKTFSRVIGVIGIGERISGNEMTCANWNGIASTGEEILLGAFCLLWTISLPRSGRRQPLSPYPPSAPLQDQVVAWSQSIWISVSFHGSPILIVHSVWKSPIGNIPNEITLDGVFANVSVYDSLLSRNKKRLE